MVGLKIGLDIGTGSVIAAVENKGVVLSEPAVLAIERETGAVIEAGKKACEMTGRCPDAIKLVRPLLSGGISALESSEKLLRCFIEKICKNKIFKPTVVATMPAGITNLEKRNILGCVLRAGAGRATLIEEPLAAALGAGVDISKPKGTMVVDIGGGTCDVCVVDIEISDDDTYSIEFIATNRYTEFGGNDFDEAVENRILSLLAPDFISGLSLLGGEPMEHSNQQGLLPLLRKVKACYPDKSIWCFSGYLFDRDIVGKMMKEWPETEELLSYIDVMVDGEYVEAQKDLSKRFKGSANQRTIDVQASLKAGEVVLVEGYE